MNQPSNSFTDKSSNPQTPTDSPKDEAALALKSTVVAQAQDLGEQAKHAASDVLSQAKQSAQSKLGSSKERAAESLGSVAEALRHTGEKMRADDKSGLTDYVVRAAEQVDSASSYLQSREFGEIIGDVSGFARREPALFLGGAFAIGLLGGRFLKSSAASRSTSASGNYSQSMQSAEPSAPAANNPARSGRGAKGQSRARGQSDG